MWIPLTLPVMRPATVLAARLLLVVVTMALLVSMLWVNAWAVIDALAPLIRMLLWVTLILTSCLAL